MTKKKAIDQKWTAHSPSQIPNNIKVKYVCAITQTLILNCFQETRHESNTAKWTTSQETGILQQVNIDVIHLNVKNSMKPMGFPGLRPGAEHFCLLTPASMRSREWTHWYVWYVQRICHMYDIHISYIYIYIYKDMKWSIKKICHGRRAFVDSRIFEHWLLMTSDDFGEEFMCYFAAYEYNWSGSTFCWKVADQRRASQP